MSKIEKEFRASIDLRGIPPMRDEAAIPHFTRTEQGDGAVCYFFGNTTIRAVETKTAGEIHLSPISGDQVACGEWVDLDEEQVRRYCDLLSHHLNSSKSGSTEYLGESAKRLYEEDRNDNTDQT